MNKRFATFLILALIQSFAYDAKLPDNLNSISLVESYVL